MKSTPKNVLIAAIAVISVGTCDAIAQDRPATSRPEASSSAVPTGASEEELTRVLAEQESNHTLRMAKIRRLREVAERSGRSADVERINQLEKRQNGLYQRRIASLRESMGTEAFDLRRMALKDKVDARARRAASSANNPEPVVRPNAPDRPNATTPTRPNADAPDRPNMPTPTRPNASAPMRPTMPTPTRPSATTPSRPTMPRPSMPTRPSVPPVRGGG